MILRTLNKNEFAKAAKIEQDCLHTAWTEEQIANIPQNAFYFGSFLGETLCGIISFYCVAGEGQVMNLAVSEEHRKKGVAMGLVEKAIEVCKENQCEYITLEVAEDNVSAISLYKKCGFDSVGSRKNFYGKVNAIIMEKKL